MIKVNIMYPNEPGARFDASYYINKHIPLIEEKMGDACTGIILEKGISGRPGTPSPYSFICTIFSPSMAQFLSGFGNVAAELDADVPNFTDLKASIQISEVIFNGTQLC